MANPTQKPPIRTLHHMARSGGSMISKCLGSMKNVVLLSEIHPKGIKQYNPIAQADQWFGLLRQEDLATIKRGMSFNDAIALIDDRCTAKGKTLVIRDWSHLDFTGVPFLDDPPYTLTLARTLARHFSIIHTASVRHPLDQWLSLSELSYIKGKIEPEDFLRGYRRFAEAAVGIGFIRYEDFTQEPDEKLHLLCERLKISFDPEYKDRWTRYKKITGGTRTNRGRSEIRPLPRRALEPQLLKRFEVNTDYQAAIELLGYADL
jgi:hypothetical protein